MTTRSGTARARATRIALAAALIASLLAIVPTGPASAADPEDFYNHSSDTTVEFPDWMSWVSDGTKISELALPGTHQSLSFFGGDAAQNQSLSLRGQLDAGIRFLDVRARMERRDDTGERFMGIYHGDVYQNAVFGDVLCGVQDFLEANPSEAVMMRLGTNGLDDTVGHDNDENGDEYWANDDMVDFVLYYMANHRCGDVLWDPVAVTNNRNAEPSGPQRAERPCNVMTSRAARRSSSCVPLNEVPAPRCSFRRSTPETWSSSTTRSAAHAHRFERTPSP